MLILVINCGSSSAKYRLFDIERNRSLAKGIVERIGQDGSMLKHERNGDVFNKKVSCKDHKVAIKIIAKILTHKEYGMIDSKYEIDGIGHRVVHGGEEFKESTLITEKVIKSIEKY